VKEYFCGEHEHNVSDSCAVDDCSIDKSDNSVAVNLADTFIVLTARHMVVIEDQIEKRALLRYVRTVDLALAGSVGGWLDLAP
jgi:hypothetical protein